MNRYRLREQDSRDEEAGEPAEPAEPADHARRASRPMPGEVRSSGVYARRKHGAPPPAEKPCRSFEEVCARYSRSVWLAIPPSRFDESEANDLFQKTFLEMLELTTALGGVPEDAEGELLDILGKHMRNHRRERGRHTERTAGEADADTMPSSKPGPEQLVAYDDGRQKVEAIIARLSPDAARVFRFVEIDGKSTEEVAATLGRTDKTVRVQLHRARRAFWDLAERLFDLKLGDSK